jgi:hypothetical protein
LEGCAAQAALQPQDEGPAARGDDLKRAKLRKESGLARSSIKGDGCDGIHDGNDLTGLGICRSCSACEGLCQCGQLLGKTRDCDRTAITEDGGDQHHTYPERRPCLPGGHNGLRWFGLPL